MLRGFRGSAAGGLARYLDLLAAWSSGTWYFSVRLPSTKGHSNFQSLFGGVAIGQCYDRHTGEGDVFHVFLRRNG